MENLGPLSSDPSCCRMLLRAKAFLLPMYLLPRGDQLGNCSLQASGEGPWNVQGGDCLPGLCTHGPHPNQGLHLESVCRGVDLGRKV